MFKNISEWWMHWNWVYVPCIYALLVVKCYLCDQNHEMNLEGREFDCKEANYNLVVVGWAIVSSPTNSVLDTRPGAWFILIAHFHDNILKTDLVSFHVSYQTQLQNTEEFLMKAEG